jgi:hypothetical protein
MIVSAHCLINKPDYRVRRDTRAKRSEQLVLTSCPQAFGCAKSFFDKRSAVRYNEPFIMERRARSTKLHRKEFSCFDF